MKTIQIFKLKLLTLFVILFLPIGGISQERNTFDLLLNTNDKETVEDIIESTKKTSKETQKKLKEGLTYWGKLEANFANLSPELQEMINKVNATGFKKIINGFLNNFSEFDSGLNKLLDKKEKLDNIIYFYDRYKPDSQNPFRSLEVLNNTFNDIESLLPEEQEYEYFKNTTAWLIRTGIGYYKLAIGNALDGLKSIQKQIKERAGDCIGYIGGDATADKNDSKRKAFTDLNTGNTICYTGLRPIGGKIYSNIDGDGVYLWYEKKWTKLTCGLGITLDVIANWKLANKGNAISSENLIYWCNDRSGIFTKAKARAQMQFDKLSKVKYNWCHDNILGLFGKKNDLSVLLESIDHNQNLFTAKYIFKKDGVRNSAEILAKLITENIFFEGHIKDENKKNIPHASVTIVAGSRRISMITDKFGYFKKLSKIPEKEYKDLPIEIKVTADNYSDLEISSKIQMQCSDLGILSLKRDSQLIIVPANSKINKGDIVDFTVFYMDAVGTTVDVTSTALTNPQFRGSSIGTFSITAVYKKFSVTSNIEVVGKNCKENEIWDNTLEDCICKQGYTKNNFDACVKIKNDSLTIIPPTEVNTTKVNNQLKQSDCANTSDAVAKWDSVSEQVICTCIKMNYKWDTEQKKCIPNVQAILANSDCSQWANTKPKWDYEKNQAYCDCVSGYVWNNDYSKCLNKQDLIVAQTDCSQYPNTQAKWDPINNKVICDCLPGYNWDKNYTKCTSKSEVLIQNADCSMYPNTEAIFDPVRQKVYCDCLPGYEWNSKYTACKKLIQQQVDQSYCSHLPNTRPIYDSGLNEWVCDCIPGYKWNRKQTACKPIHKKPNIDWENVLALTVGVLNAVNQNNPSAISPGYNPGNVPTSMQQPVRHQSNCNDQQQAGGDPPEEHTIDLGQSYGSFIFDYNTETQKDQIIIMNGGMKIFDSGCVGESKSIPIQLRGYSPTITVRVNPNCNGGSGTKWYFTVHCPNN